MSLTIGLVTLTHPEDNSVDLVMIEDGARLSGVQVLSTAASSRSGHVDLPEPGLPPSGDKWSISEARERQDLIAIVAYMGRQPVVIGFLFPQICQMLFKRLNFRVDRHVSDVYATLDDQANFEWAHPSGSHIRIAEDPEHEDLTGQDFDGKWKIDRNTARAPWLSVTLKNAGDQVFRMRVDPSGNVTLVHEGNLTVESGGNVAVTAAGSMTLTASTITLDGPTNVIGGSLTHNGTNVGDDHVHGGVDSGPSDTQGPS